MAYLPDQAVATGAAVIVCPGGAFHGLAIEHEGIDVARWLNGQGVAAFVLKYRLVRTPASDEEFLRQVQEAMQRPASERDTRMLEVTRPVVPLAVADGRQAMKLVRERAAEWDLAQDRIGMVGFSAGGRVVAGVALEHDDASRPDFAGVIYGALWEEITVPPDAPPLFIALAANDDLAVRPCLDLYSAWWSTGHPAELHIYAQGGHGFGMRKQGLPIDTWIDRFADWLGAQRLLETQRPAVTAHSAASGA
jgi:acetyl esterase/lipase